MVDIDLTGEEPSQVAGGRGDAPQPQAASPRRTGATAENASLLGKAGGAGGDDAMSDGAGGGGGRHGHRRSPSPAGRSVGVTPQQQPRPRVRFVGSPTAAADAKEASHGAGAASKAAAEDALDEDEATAAATLTNLSPPKHSPAWPPASKKRSRDRAALPDPDVWARLTERGRARVATRDTRVRPPKAVTDLLPERRLPQFRLPTPAAAARAEDEVMVWALLVRGAPLPAAQLRFPAADYEGDTALADGLRGCAGAAQLEAFLRARHAPGRRPPTRRAPAAVAVAGACPAPGEASQPPGEPSAPAAEAPADGGADGQARPSKAARTAPGSPGQQPPAAATLAAAEPPPPPAAQHAPSQLQSQRSSGAAAAAAAAAAGGGYSCRYCNEPGHNRRTCPALRAEMQHTELREDPLCCFRSGAVRCRRYGVWAEAGVLPPTPTPQPTPQPQGGAAVVPLPDLAGEAAAAVAAARLFCREHAAPGAARVLPERPCCSAGCPEWGPYEAPASGRRYCAAHRPDAPAAARAQPGLPPQHWEHRAAVAGAAAAQRLRALPHLAPLCSAVELAGSRGDEGVRGPLPLLAARLALSILGHAGAKRVCPTVLATAQLGRGAAPQKAEPGAAGLPRRGSAPTLLAAPPAAPSAAPLAATRSLPSGASSQGVPKLVTTPPQRPEALLKRREGPAREGAGPEAGPAPRAAAAGPPAPQPPQQQQPEEPPQQQQQQPQEQAAQPVAAAAPAAAAGSGDGAAQLEAAIPGLRRLGVSIRDAYRLRKVFQHPTLLSASQRAVLLADMAEVAASGSTADARESVEFWVDKLQPAQRGGGAGAP